jgi:hypothetical protein
MVGERETERQRERERERERMMMSDLKAREGACKSTIVMPTSRAFLLMYSLNDWILCTVQRIQRCY